MFHVESLEFRFLILDGGGWNSICKAPVSLSRMRWIRGTVGDIPLLSVAMIQLGLNQKEQALQRLEEAYEVRDGDCRLHLSRPGIVRDRSLPYR